MDFFKFHIMLFHIFVNINQRAAIDVGDIILPLLGNNDNCKRHQE